MGVVPEPPERAGSALLDLSKAGDFEYRCQESIIHGENRVFFFLIFVCFYLKLILGSQTFAEIFQGVSKGF